MHGFEPAQELERTAISEGHAGAAQREPDDQSNQLDLELCYNAPAASQLGQGKESSEARELPAQGQARKTALQHHLS